MTTTLGYYPGCSLKGSSSEYDHSVHAVAERLDIKLQEVPEWNCCGASSAHALDPAAALCLATDTLIKAREAGMQDILAPCAMCYQRLATAVHEISEKPALARRLEKVFETKPDVHLEQMRALNLMDWLETVPPEKLKSQVRRPLKGLKVACYYGCMLVRPPKVVGVENCEAPRSMEHIVSALGAETVRWSMATECCGASMSLCHKQSVIRQVNHITEAAHKAGANVMCVACPLCQLNVDTRQGDGTPPMPVLFLSQLIALAFDVPEPDIGLKGHFVSVDPLLATLAKATSEEASAQCRA